MHIANIYVSYIFKCFPKVKEHWLIHKINGENAAEMKTFTMEYTPLDLARSVSNFSNKKCIELLEDIEGTVFSFRNAQQRDGK